MAGPKLVYTVTANAEQAIDALTRLENKAVAVGAKAAPAFNKVTTSLGGMRASFNSLNFLVEDMSRHLFYGYVQIGLFARGVEGLVKPLYDFEKGMSDAGAMLEGGYEELNNYREQIKELSKEWGIMPDKALGAAKELLSAQIDVTDLEEALNVSMMTSVAMSADLDTTVTALTKTMHAYNMEVEDMVHISDVLVDIIDVGDANAQDLAEHWNSLVAVAGPLGVSLSDVAAAFSVVSKVPDVAESVTALRRAYVTFINATDSAKEKAAEFGVTLSSAWLKTHGMQEFIHIMYEAGATAEDLADIFTRERGYRAIALLMDNMDDLDVLTERFTQRMIEEGLAAAIAADKMEQFHKQVDVLRVNINLAALSMAESLRPELEALIENLTDFTDTISDSDEAAHQFGVTLIKVGSAILGFMVLSTLTRALLNVVDGAKLLLTVLKKIIPSFSTLRTIVTGAWSYFEGFATAMQLVFGAGSDLWPILQWIGTVGLEAAASIAVFGLALYDILEGFKQVGAGASWLAKVVSGGFRQMVALPEMFLVYIQKITEWNGKATQAIADWMKEISNGHPVVDKMADLLDTLANAFDVCSEAAKTWAMAVGNWADKAAIWLGAYIDDMRSKLQSLAAEMAEGYWGGEVTTEVTHVKDWTGSAGMGDFYVNHVEASTEALDNLYGVYREQTEAVDSFGSSLEDVGGSAKDTADKLAELAKAAVSFAQNLGSALSGILNTSEGADEGGMPSGALGAFTTGFFNTADYFAEEGSGIAAMLEPFKEAQTEDLFGAFSESLSMAALSGADMNSIGLELRSTYDDLFGLVESGSLTETDALNQFYTTGVENLESRITSMGRSLTFLNSIGLTTSSIADNISERFMSAFSAIQSGSMSAGEAFKQMALGIVQDFLSMIQKALLYLAIQMIINSITGGVTGTDSGVSAWTSAVSQIGTSLVEGLGDSVTSTDNYAWAEGGVVDKARVGLIGESGPEAIVPLSGGRAIPVDMNEKQSETAQGDIYVVKIDAIDQKSVTKFFKENTPHIINMLKKDTQERGSMSKLGLRYRT